MERSEREILSYTPAEAIPFLHAEAQKIFRHCYTYVNNVQFHSEIYICKMSSSPLVPHTVYLQRPGS
jgi:hypothetical protein